MTGVDRLRLLRTLLLLPVVSALYGCGVPATGVIEAGEPATGVIRPGGTVSDAPPPAVVYFLGPDGRLVPSGGSVDSFVRPTAVPSANPTIAPGTDNSADLERVLLILAKGPTSLERDKGVTSELPPLKALPRVQSRHSSVLVEFPRGPHLSDKAAEQVICTVAAARRAKGLGGASGRVTVLGGAGERYEGTEAGCLGY
ncbi:MAG: hypothetical protein LBV60_10500 [Streptomyces sp.]|jgi:hypothetical protein|nr:hypothetical protein [Streptomyces sp.]